MSNFVRTKVMKQLRNTWLTGAVEDFNKVRVPKGMKPLTVKDCITLTFYLFNFLAPGEKRAAGEKPETGALACTWTDMKVPAEPLEADERAKLHQLCDSLKLEQGYNVSDIKDISCTLNFQDWSIEATVTLKTKDPETNDYKRDSQIWN